MAGLSSRSERLSLLAEQAVVHPLDTSCGVLRRSADYGGVVRVIVATVE